MESVKTNDAELTSTMGNLLSTSKDDKNDASDSTPTSSTDAFTTTSTSQIAADDPISSTSSDVLDSKKSTEKVNDVAQSSMNVISSNLFMSSLKEMSMGDNTPLIVSEKDLLDMNITDTSTEKITENVDDIVQDLENLLGEPTTSFEFTIRPKDGNRNSSSVAEKDISMDIDAFSAELQMLSEQSTEPKEIIKKALKVSEATVLQNNVIEPQKIDVSEALDTTENTNEEHPKPTPVLAEKESLSVASQSSELSTNTSDIKTDTIEKINDQIENCQFEIISASSANTEVISVEKSDFSETEHITSTQSKNEEESAPVTKEIKHLNGENQVQSNDTDSTENEVVKGEGETSTSSAEVNTMLEKSAENEKYPVSEEVINEGVYELEEKTAECEKQTVSNEVTSEQKMDEIEERTLETSSQESNLESIPEALSSKSYLKEQQQLTPRESEQMQVEEIGDSKGNVVDNVPESSLVVESIKQLDDIRGSETIAEHEDHNVVEEETKVANAVDKTASVESEAEKDDSAVAEEVIKTRESVEYVQESSATCTIVKEVNEAKTEELETVSDAEVKNNVKEIESKEILEDIATDVGKTQTSKTTQAEEEKTEAGEKMEVDATLDEDNQNEKMELEPNDNPKRDESVLVVTVDEVSRSKKMDVASTSTANEKPTERAAPVDEDKQEFKIEIEAAERMHHVEEKTEDPIRADVIIQEAGIYKEEDKPVEEKCDSEIEVAAIPPEITEQTQPVSSSSEEEKNQQEISETCDIEAHISGEILQPSEAAIVDQQQTTEEDIETGNSEELLTVCKNEAIGTSAEDQSQHKAELQDVHQTVISISTELQKKCVPEQINTPGDLDLQPEGSSEQSIASPVEITTLEHPNEDFDAIAADLEGVSRVTPVDFIPDPIEIPTRSLADDLDLLVQNAVNDDTPVEAPALFEEKNENNLLIPTSSDDNLKSLEGVIENNILPLVMEDVPDLDVLNAISTLSDNKSTNIPEVDQNIQQSDALLTSSSLEQTSTGDASFEANIESSLPTVEEIFAEPNQQQPVELQDDNLETLLAVASLQNVDYSIPPVEDFTPPVEPVPDFALEEPVPPVEDLPNFVTEESAAPVGVAQNFASDKSSSTLDEVPNFVPKESVRPVEDVATFVPEESELPVLRLVPVESVLPIEEDMRLGPEEAQLLPVEEPPKAESLSQNKEPPTGNSKPEKTKRSELKDEELVQEDKLKEPLIINIEDSDKERVYSPKITIKPIKPPEEEEAVSSASGENESSKGSLKMTITKQSDNTHSILKIYDPDDDNTHTEDYHQSEPSVPKLIIKPIIQPNEQPQSPKMSTRSSKQVFSPSSSASQRSASPRITIKPIPKPEESVAPLKITIKPVLKADESHKQKHSPKLTIKPILKPEEDCVELKVHSPRVTIKPIVKPLEEVEQVSSPRITIKPIIKPAESVHEPSPTTPRVTIKPVVKPTEKDKNTEVVEQVEKSSPKITIKPIVRPQEIESIPVEDYEESIKERIVLKINKGTIPCGSKELRKREVPQEEEKSEKLTKIKLKFSKEGGHPHIVQDQSPTKRSAEQVDHDKNKRQRLETEHFLPGVTITPITPTTHSKLKEMLSRNENLSSDKVVTIDDDDDDVTIVEEQGKPSPIVISEESNQDSMPSAAIDLRDPISEIPVFEITPDSVKTINPQTAVPVVEVPAPLPAPRKRGRPRKVPLQVREDFKDPKEEEPKPVVVESTRPKRSCRGQSVRATLGIKPRKPRGPGRGRGSKRGMGTRSTPTPETPPKPAKEPKLGGTKLKELKEDSFLLSDKSEVKTIEIDDGLQKSPSNSLLAPPQSDTSTADRADIVMYEEETRMSAETSSRAQTPAKQVVTTIPTVDLVEESQSSIQSIQSTATTESVKVRKGPRLEVHQEPEGAVISADQLAEYYWSGGGPYMLQEQVAQFLGIKSFKRKYPNISRRVVDMQERDFIRESGLAGEAMCDLGLTAVNSSDILDIMYSDFQDKYEEYCKHQRDRQAKDLINKQKALSLAASQEKAKMDITQQAVQSAASWNASFNKARRDQRKSCMDLQTLTIHFPKGRMKQISKPKMGYYPVALVPGQFTDYYREFTPTEINNLPLNTMCYDPIIRNIHQEMECDSQTDGSGSESDSSSSDSDSSYSGSSDAEDCTLCKPTPKRVAAAQ